MQHQASERATFDCTDFETEIDAPAEVVFDTMKDVGAWSSWTSAVKKAWARSEGPWRRGYKFVMKTIISAAPLPMTVYEYEEDRLIAWGVKNPLFTVLHRIHFEPLGEKRCRVRNHEFVEGPLAHIVGRLVGKRIDRFDRQLAADLAVRCGGGDRDVNASSFHRP
jgi:polyketide cyclase/dehydrase/lipid transport protein